MTFCLRFASACENFAVAKSAQEESLVKPVNRISNCGDFGPTSSPFHAVFLPQHGFLFKSVFNVLCV